MENLLNYEINRNLIYNNIFSKTGLKRQEFIILLSIYFINKDKILLKEIKEKVYSLPYSELNKSIKKLDRQDYIKKSIASYDERIVIIKNIDFPKIVNVINEIKKIIDKYKL